MIEPDFGGYYFYSKIFGFCSTETSFSETEEGIGSFY
jgi:hypothetical protein